MPKADAVKVFRSAGNSQRAGAQGQRLARSQSCSGRSLKTGPVRLLIDAIDTKRHRYVNLGVVAIMVGGVAFDWIRARRRRTKP